MTDYELRLQALQMAQATGNAVDSASTLRIAEEYSDFIRGKFNPKEKEEALATIKRLTSIASDIKKTIDEEEKINDRIEKAMDTVETITSKNKIAVKNARNNRNTKSNSNRAAKKR